MVTELPYIVGPEKVIERIKDLVQAKKLHGIADVKDLTDRNRGLHLVIEVKQRVQPRGGARAALPADPDGGLVRHQQRRPGRRPAADAGADASCCEVYVDTGIDVVRRRTAVPPAQAAERLHLVEGLLVAILDIDEVIQVIRSSDDAAAAKARLMAVFDLSEIQAKYILEMPLRRLTRFSRIELETERDELRRADRRARARSWATSSCCATVSDELAEVAKAHGTPRRTVLLESAPGAPPRRGPRPLEVADDPCWVLLSSTGLLARTSTADPLPSEGGRAKHDVVVAAVRTTARGEVGLVTSRGRMLRLSALELPTLPPRAAHRACPAVHRWRRSSTCRAARSR